MNQNWDLLTAKQYKMGMGLEFGSAMLGFNALGR